MCKNGVRMANPLFLVQDLALIKALLLVLPFSPIRNEIFVEIFHGKSGNWSEIVKVETSMRWSFMKKENDVRCRGVFVFSLQLERCDQFG